MARILLSFSLPLVFLGAAFSTPLSTQSNKPHLSTAEPITTISNLPSIVNAIALLSILGNSTALIENTSWDPRVTCFRHTTYIPNIPIIRADYEQALAKISDMPDFNVPRQWPRSKLSLWQYNEATIALRVRTDEPTTEETRFAPAFVALCARLIAARCFTPTLMLGGMARFGPEARFWVQVIGERDGVAIA